MVIKYEQSRDIKHQKNEIKTLLAAKVDPFFMHDLNYVLKHSADRRDKWESFLNKNQLKTPGRFFEKWSMEGGVGPGGYLETPS